MDTLFSSSSPPRTLAERRHAVKLTLHGKGEVALKKMPRSALVQYCTDGGEVDHASESVDQLVARLIKMKRNASAAETKRVQALLLPGDVGATTTKLRAPMHADTKQLLWDRQAQVDPYVYGSGFCVHTRGDYERLGMAVCIEHTLELQQANYALLVWKHALFGGAMRPTAAHRTMHAAFVSDVKQRINSAECNLVMTLSAVNAVKLRPTRARLAALKRSGTAPSEPGPYEPWVCSTVPAVRSKDSTGTRLLYLSEPTRRALHQNIYAAQLTALDRVLQDMPDTHASDVFDETLRTVVAFFEPSE